MLNFFRRQKPKEEKSSSNSFENGPKKSKDTSKAVLPIRIFKCNDEVKNSAKNVAKDPPHQLPTNLEDSSARIHGSKVTGTVDEEKIDVIINQPIDHVTTDPIAASAEKPLPTRIDCDIHPPIYRSAFNKTPSTYLTNLRRNLEGVEPSNRSKSDQRLLNQSTEVTPTFAKLPSTDESRTKGVLGPSALNEFDSNDLSTKLCEVSDQTTKSHVGDQVGNVETDPSKHEDVDTDSAEAGISSEQFSDPIYRTKSEDPAFDRETNARHSDNHEPISSRLSEKIPNTFVDSIFAEETSDRTGEQIVISANNEVKRCDICIPEIIIQDVGEMGASESNLQEDVNYDVSSQDNLTEDRSSEELGHDLEFKHSAVPSLSEGDVNENEAKDGIVGERDTDKSVVHKKEDDNSLHHDFSSGENEPAFEDAVSSEEQRLNLVNKEARESNEQIQDRLAELRAELTSREAEALQLRYQLEEAQKQLLNKSRRMDRLQNELLTSNQEAESAKDRLKSLENNLNAYQQKDSNLNQDIFSRKPGLEHMDGSTYLCTKCEKLEKTLEALKRKVRDLEEQVDAAKKERDRLEEEANSWETEREQEIKIVQRALEDAEKEQNTIRQRFEKDFEALRTVNSNREQQLLDDFEWKLREVEQACKKRLSKREQVVREQCLEEQIRLKDQLQELELKLQQVQSNEAELNQLRGLTNEQQRSLKVATKQVEQLENSEKILKEEMEKLKSVLQKEKAHLATMQGIHNREIAEKERKFQFKLEQYKTEIDSQVDEKVQRECARLKIELERQHKEERRADVEQIRQEIEKEMQSKKQNWDRRMQECIKEIDALQKKLGNKDKEYKQELERIQTISDRDTMELRRKLDKMDMSYQEKLEKAHEKLEKETERIMSECEKRIAQSEQQASTARTTLELVKEQHERELEEKLDEMRLEHQRGLQEQWEKLVQEKEEALEIAEQRHRAASEKLRAELDSIYKTQNSNDTQTQKSKPELSQDYSNDSDSRLCEDSESRVCEDSERIHSSDEEQDEESTNNEFAHFPPSPPPPPSVPLFESDATKSHLLDCKVRDRNKGRIQLQADRSRMAFDNGFENYKSDGDLGEMISERSRSLIHSRLPFLSAPVIEVERDHLATMQTSVCPLTCIQLDENRERTGNTQTIQPKSSRRKRRSRGQRSRMHSNFVVS